MNSLTKTSRTRGTLSASKRASHVDRAVPGAVALLVAATLLGACSGDDEKKDSEASTPLCSPGETRVCVGPGACDGGQQCSNDGAAWSECDCGSSPSSGDTSADHSSSTGNGDSNSGSAGASGTGESGSAGDSASSGGEPGGAAGADDGSSALARVACSIAESKLTLPAVYRDFSADHPDFEPSVSGQTEATTGLVAESLGDDGLPELAESGGAITDEESFAQWYQDDEEVNVTVRGSFVLFDDGNGGYVNRWGADGEQWTVFVYDQWCGASDAGCDSCGELAEGMTCYDPCPTDSGQVCSGAEVAYDGTPFFFPVDDVGDDITPSDQRVAATIPPEYGGNWETEADSPKHNFHFTSELRFWFQYDAGRSSKIEITGDDDVWVFVNGSLALDLGGIHTPVRGEVVIANLPGLEAGTQYEVAIFQAERQTTGSTLRLRLTDFDWATLECPAE